MAMSKLTLTAPPEIISLAEEQARLENTSISAMFSNFIMAKTKMSASHHSRQKVGPLTKSLTGIVRLPDGFDYFRCGSQYGLSKPCNNENLY